MRPCHKNSSNANCCLQGEKKQQKSAVKTSVKIEQTLKACHSFRIYSIQERELDGKAAPEKNGNILQGGLPHLSFQVALKYVIVRVPGSLPMQ